MSGAKVSYYEFLNPYISENILDVTSIHRNYLYHEEESHFQECFISSKWLNLKYNTYNGKNYGIQVANQINFDGSKRIKVIWPGHTSNLFAENEKLKLNVGFQCIPVNNTLSILTSLAFRKDAYFLSSDLTVTVNINETVTLSMFESELHEENETMWRKDGKKLKNFFIEPQNVSRTSITLTNTDVGYSGIYSLEYKDYNLPRRGYMRLLVRACPEGKYGNFCNNECPECLNGGICHDITGTCICAPGFSGSNCEETCEVGFVGRNCSVNCNMDLQSSNHTCEGLLICLPDPYGCSCAAGFFGPFCNKTCLTGTYGAGCRQQRYCNCAHGEGCDIYSGDCKGNCAEGWYGKYCNDTPLNVSNLSYDLISPTSINLTWEHPIEPFSPVKYYILAYKQIEWRMDCDKPIFEKIVKKIVTQSCIFLENLKPFSVYSMNVSAVTVTSGPPLEIIVETPSTAPPPPSKFQVSYKTTSSLFLSWNTPYPQSGLLDSYEVAYRHTENSSFSKISINNLKASCDYQSKFNCFVLKHLMRNQEYEIQLKAFNVNVSESSEPLIIKAGTSISEPEPDVEISILDQKDRKVTVHILRKTDVVDLENSDTTSSYFIIVDSSDNNPPIRDFIKFIYIKSKCNQLDSVTYVAGTLDIIPTRGINFTVGNNSCFNGYYNPPLKTKTTYRFGLLPVLSHCKENIYGPVVYTGKVIIKSHSILIGVTGSLSSAKSLRIVLGLLLPLAVILAVIVIFMYMQKPKSFDALALKRRFFHAKAESELAVCNEGLDELDIIETESINEDLSNVLSVKELSDYVKHNVKNNKIRKEFMSIPKGQMYPCFTAKLDENKFKNRYGNILPYDHSRVILKENGDSQYIHANYMDGYKKARKYIATQGPMPLTIQDFWSMVWQEKVSKIIMITNLEENGKCKCEKYWSEEVITYGPLDLQLKCCENYADFLIRTFNLSKDHNSREVKQFHFTSWPDHGVPLNTTPFLNFLKKVQVNANYDEPVIVHCSAGIGRTGAVIFFENSFDMGIQEGNVDVLGQLCSMRKQRMNIVETYEQYMFVLHALVEALCIEKTSVCSQNFVKEFEQILVPDKDTGVNIIEKQFKMLSDLPIPPSHTDILAAYMVSNQAKNRSMHILPSERARPILQKYPNYTDYINAVYLDGYRCKNKYVATQYPLPDTVIDFWRMVFELNSKIVVLLQDIPFSEMKNPQLLPLHGVQNFDIFDVECVSVDEENGIVISNLKVKHTTLMKEAVLKLIQVKYWSVDDNLPPDPSGLLLVMKWIQKLESDVTNQTIITICLDGVTACGIFCSFLYIVDRMKSENEIDIFQTAKCMRTNRPQFITNMEQYRFLFTLTEAYLANI